MDHKKKQYRVWTLCIAVVSLCLIGGVFVFGVAAINNFRVVEESWETHTSQSSEIRSSLEQARNAIGYGGYIHSFKNYVLRRDATYLAEMDRSTTSFKIAVSKLYQQLKTADEHAALQDLETTFAQYQALAEQFFGIQSTGSAEEVDLAVRVNDTPALNALNLLHRSVQIRSDIQLAQAESDYNHAVVFLYYGALIAVAIAAAAGFMILFLRRIMASNVALDAATEQMGSILTSSPDAMICARRDGTIFRANTQAAKLFEFPKEQIIGMQVQDLLPGHFTSLAIDPDTIGKNTPSTNQSQEAGDFLALTQTGARPLVDVSLGYSGSDDTAVAILTIRDVTEQRRMQDSLVAAVDAAERANRTKSAFLANMSHEIRTPLTGVLGMADVLQSTELTETQTSYVTALQQSGQHLLGVLNDILDLSKLEAGQVTIQSLPFSPDQLGNSISSMFRPVAEAKNIKLSVDIDAGPTDMTLTGDITRLRQVAFNLVGNAVKFSEGGTVSVTGTISPSPEANTATLTLEVRDTGIGIPEDQQGSIFDVFQQVESDPGLSLGGTGLGLSISKRLAEQMGGSISVKSMVGIGSVFTVTVKLGLRDDTSVQRPIRIVSENTALEAEEALRPKPTGLKVLLADDNAMNRKLISTMLTHFGHQITTVSDGKQACEKTASERFDVVLLDIHMPVMDGRTALGVIKQQGISDSTKIIALTADIMPENIVEYKQEGFDACVEKPIDWNALELAMNVDPHLAAVASGR